MIFNLPLLSQNGTGLNLGLGDWNQDGKLDFRFGLSQFQGYGNGLAGGYNQNEIGWGSGGMGGYLEGAGANWNPMQSSGYNWGSSNLGTYSNQGYGDVFGNYASNSYAADVFGDWQNGSVMGNPMGSYGQQSFGSPWGAQTFSSFGGPALGGWFGGPQVGGGFGPMMPQPYGFGNGCGCF